MTAILFPPVAGFARTTCLVQDKKPTLFCGTSVRISSIAAVVTVVFGRTLASREEMAEAVRLSEECEEKVIPLQMTPLAIDEKAFLPVEYGLQGYSCPSVAYIIYSVKGFTKLDEGEKALLHDVTLQMKRCFPCLKTSLFLDTRIYENPVRGYRLW